MALPWVSRNLDRIPEGKWRIRGRGSSRTPYSEKMIPFIMGMFMGELNKMTEDTSIHSGKDPQTSKHVFISAEEIPALVVNVSSRCRGMTVRRDDRVRQKAST